MGIYDPIEELERLASQHAPIVKPAVKRHSFIHKGQAGYYIVVRHKGIEVAFRLRDDREKSEAIAELRKRRYQLLYAINVTCKRDHIVPHTGRCRVACKRPWA